ncbi:MAG: helix-turn-helix domain-containing protein [Victivallales bacterium]|nr:helix-turn-helix domain-containing protein [Victivallales bacterium]
MLGNVTFYTLHEVAAKFGVSYQMVYNLVRAGELPAYRFGKSYRVAEKDLEEYLQKQRVQVRDEVVEPIILHKKTPLYPPQLIARETMLDTHGEGAFKTAEALPHTEQLEAITLLIGGFAVYICAKEKVKFGRHPERNDFAVVDWKNNAKPSERPTSTVSREQLEICSSDGRVLLFTKKDSTRIDGVTPATSSKNGIPLPPQCRLSMGDIAFQLKIHTDEAHKVQSVTLAREDGLPEGFAIVWQCCDLGVLDGSLTGLHIYRRNGGFLLLTPSGTLLGLSDGMKWQEGPLAVEAHHFAQRLIGSSQKGQSTALG